MNLSDVEKETDVYIVYKCNVKTEYRLEYCRHTFFHSHINLVLPFKNICGALPLTNAFAVKTIRNTDAFDLNFIHLISSETAVADLLLSTNELSLHS